MPEVSFGGELIWLFDIAMENPQKEWRFIAGKIIYFYEPSIPWRTVSHNQMVIPIKTHMAIENLIVPYDK